MTSKYYLLALANEIEGTPARLYADAFRNSIAKIKTQTARIAELEAALATARRETEQERDEFFNRLGRITEYLELPIDATAQRIIETIREHVENEREACAGVEVRVIVPDGAETWTPLEAWEEAIIAFDEAFRRAIRAALEGGKKE